MLSAVCSNGAFCWTLGALPQLKGSPSRHPAPAALAAARSGVSPHGAEQHNLSLSTQRKHSDSQITLCPKSKDQKLPNTNVFPDFNDLQIREIRRGQWERGAKHMALGSTTSCGGSAGTWAHVPLGPPLQGGCDALRTHGEENPSHAGELLLCQLKHPGTHRRTTRYLPESWRASWHTRHRCSGTSHPPQSAAG